MLFPVLTRLTAVLAVACCCDSEDHFRESTAVTEFAHEVLSAAGGMIGSANRG